MSTKPAGALHAAVGGDVGRARLPLAEPHGAGETHRRQGREAVGLLPARVGKIEELHERRVGFLARRAENPVQRTARGLRRVGDVALDLEPQAVGSDELAGANGEAALLDADVEVDIAQLAAVGDQLTGAQAQVQVGRRRVEPGERRLRQRSGLDLGSVQHALQAR